MACFNEILISFHFESFDSPPSKVLSMILAPSVASQCSIAQMIECGGKNNFCGGLIILCGVCRTGGHLGRIKGYQNEGQIPRIIPQKTLGSHSLLG